MEDTDNKTTNVSCDKIVFRFINLSEICFQESNLQSASISSDTGFVLNRQKSSSEPMMAKSANAYISHLALTNTQSIINQAKDTKWLCQMEWINRTSFHQSPSKMVMHYHIKISNQQLCGSTLHTRNITNAHNAFKTSNRCSLLDTLILITGKLTLVIGYIKLTMTAGYTKLILITGHVKLILTTSHIKSILILRHILQLHLFLDFLAMTSTTSTVSSISKINLQSFLYLTCSDLDQFICMYSLCKKNIFTIE